MDSDIIEATGLVPVLSVPFINDLKTELNGNDANYVNAKQEIEELLKSTEILKSEIKECMESKRCEEKKVVNAELETKEYIKTNELLQKECTELKRVSQRDIQELQTKGNLQ
jgi:predicted XRE-type DNA-binding protein